MPTDAVAKLEDFGILEEVTPEDRIRAHQEKCKSLPREAKAEYWRHVYKAEPDLFKLMNGRDYKEAARKRRVVKRR